MFDPVARPQALLGRDAQVNTERMAKDTPRARLLIALLDLARRREVSDLSSLAEEAGLTSYRTLKELSALHEQGWVDARRLRLTLAGLAVAVALDAATAGGERVVPDAGSQRGSRGRLCVARGHAA